MPYWLERCPSSIEEDERPSVINVGVGASCQVQPKSKDCRRTLVRANPLGWLNIGHFEELVAADGLADVRPRLSESKRLVDVADQHIHRILIPLASVLNIVFKHILADSISVTFAPWFTAQELTILAEPRSPVRQPVSGIFRLGH